MLKIYRFPSIIAAISLSLLTISPALAAENAPAAPAAASTAAPAPAAANTVKTEEKAVATHVVKIGYVSMMKISEESTIGKVSKEKFKAKAEKAKAQVQSREKQLDKQKKALEAKLPTLPPKEREARIKEFEKKVSEYRTLVQGLDKQLSSEEEDLTSTMFKQIEQAAVAYGKANGFSAILPKQELLYLDSGVDAQDVTEAVLKIMEDKGKK